MKKLFIILTLLLNLSIGHSQELIKEAKVSLILPNDNWKIKDKVDKKGMQIYYFEREPIIDSIGRKIIPNISVIVEDIDIKLDAVTYSIIKRQKVHFKVIDTFIYDGGLIEFNNAIGYKGTYNDKLGEHTVYVIHGINNNKGFQIIFDVLTELFADLDKEFKVTLKSIKKEE